MIVKLSGSLKRFGESYEIKRRSAWEAWRLLSVQIPGLAREVFSHPEIAIIADGDCLTRELLTLEFDCSELVLLPIPKGADFGISELIAAEAIAGATSLGFGAGTAGVIGSIVGGIVSALPTVALVGLSMGMSLAQASAASAPKRDPNGNLQAQSYRFNGVSNTAQEGVAIPLIFGRVRVGGIITSYNQYSEVRQIK